MRTVAGHRIALRERSALEGSTHERVCGGILTEGESLCSLVSSTSSSTSAMMYNLDNLQVGCGARLMLRRDH